MSYKRFFFKEVRQRNRKERALFNHIRNYHELERRRGSTVEVKETDQMNQENTFNSQLLDQIRVLTENQLRLHRERTSLMEQMHQNTRKKDEMELEVYNVKNISKNLVFQIEELRTVLSEKQVENDQLLLEITRRNEEIFKIDLTNQKYREKLEAVLQRNVELTNENLLLEKKNMTKSKGYNKPLPTMKKRSNSASIPGRKSTSPSQRSRSVVQRARLSYVPHSLSHQVDAHDGQISSMGVFTEGKYPMVVTGGESDQLLKIWDLEGNLASEIKVNLGGMIRFLSIDKNRLAVGGRSREIHVFEIDPNNLNPNNRTKMVLKGHSKSITCCKVVNKFVISGSLDKTVKVWSLENNMIYRTFQLKSDVLSLCVMNPVFFCTSHADGIIRFFDFRNPKVVKEVETKNNPPITMMGYTSAKNMLMVKSNENFGYLMDIGTFSFVNEFNFQNSSSNFCFDKSGSLIMNGTSTSSLMLWDLDNSKKCKAVFKNAHNGSPITQVMSCSPYNYFSGDSNGKLNFYSLKCVQL